MIFNIFMVLFVIFGLEDKITCSMYKQLNIESDKVCQQLNGLRTRRISTGHDGLIIKQDKYFENLSGKYEFTCRFELYSGFEDQFPGIFVVIQKLFLRKDPKTGECIDYLRIRPVDKDFISEISTINLHLKKNKNPWIMFCGDLSARRDGSRKNDDSSEFSITGYSSDNVIEVEIHIDKKSTQNESLQLEVAFTPFTPCKSIWSEYKECGMKKCIKKQHFGDKVVNCPYLNCPDEGGCDLSLIETDITQDLQTKVTITAAMSIFCSFFLFLGCIWCCRYMELLCWSANTLLGRANPVELSPIHQPSPTAPPEAPQNKDLPPAYETLFPERSKELGEMCTDL